VACAEAGGGKSTARNRLHKTVNSKYLTIVIDLPVSQASRIHCCHFPQKNQPAIVFF
jgi:hypothetical protein